MMLDVIPVIEECEVVEATVVARCSAGMLEVSMQMAKSQSESDPWQIDCHEKPRIGPDEHSPESSDQQNLRRHAPRPTKAYGLAAMVRDVTISPDALRNAQKSTEIERIQAIDRV